MLNNGLYNLFMSHVEHDFECAFVNHGLLSLSEMDLFSLKKQIGKLTV